MIGRAGRKRRTIIIVITYIYIYRMSSRRVKVKVVVRITTKNIYGTRSTRPCVRRTRVTIGITVFRGIPGRVMLSHISEDPLVNYS